MADIVNEQTPEETQSAALDSALLEVAKALLDETRLMILGLSAQAPQTVETLATATGERRAALPRHLEQLRSLGLLTVQPDASGNESYRLDVKKLQEYKRRLFAGAPVPTPETTEAQVLANFVRGGKLVTIPAQESKKLVVLQWLAQQFVPGATYAERDVNLILAQFHEDTAALRRYLVDYGFMQRNAGIYRRSAAA